MFIFDEAIECQTIVSHEQVDILASVSRHVHLERETPSRVEEKDGNHKELKVSLS